MHELLQWAALVVGLLWVTSVARRNDSHVLGVFGTAAARMQELQRQHDELRQELDALKRAVGYDEERRRLDRNVVYEEAARSKALGSLFPRVGSVEWELRDLQVVLDDAIKANGLKDPRTMSWAEISQNERRRD